MMYYLESPCTDPHFNLALEQHIFDNLSAAHSYFMFWRNNNAIIVGKHQNTVEEINARFVRDNNIKVVRRLSGGGAVYHDLGNLNFTFITDAKDGSSLDFSDFCRPVIAALTQLGIPAKISGRNDMTIDGKKFSGNAQYLRNGRVMHHGTILFDSNLDTITNSLAISRDKIESKGLKSIRGRVSNIKPYLSEDISIAEFQHILKDYLTQSLSMTPYHLGQQDIDTAKRLQRERYQKWEWNYGASPAFAIRKERRVENCGKVEIQMNVSEGRIAALAFSGDFFSVLEPGDLAAKLLGVRLEEAALLAALEGVRVTDYLQGLSARSLVEILLL